MSAAVETAIQEDERRARRDSHRAAGGSRRRPLKSFMTTAEKRELRDEHAARLRTAVEELREPGGFEAWLEALGLNPHLSPMNAALVALQSPGEVAASAAGWKRMGWRVRRGERLAGRITAPGFWPLPYFTAAQAGALDLAESGVGLPLRAESERLRAALTASLDEGIRPREALEAMAARVRLRAGDWEERPEAAYVPQELPF